MKHFILSTFALIIITFSLGGCKQEFITYDGPSYIQFTDTLLTCPAFEDNKEFAIHLVSTRAVDYDRTYAVEIVPEKSNAVYNQHFTIVSHTVTVKAGSTVGEMNLKPIYQNINREDDIKVELRIVSQLNDQWSEQSSTTKVVITKICPFDINNYTGKCEIYSGFLSSIVPSQSVRTVDCVKVEGEENTILVKGLFATGYDVKMKFDLSDPLDLKMNIVGEQVIGYSPDLLGASFTENRLFASDAPGYPPILSTCYGEALQYIKIKIGPYINIYPTLYHWIEDYEAE